MVRVTAFFFRSSWKKIVLAAASSSIAAGLNILSIKYLSDIITVPDVNLINTVLFIALFVTGSTIISITVGKYITKHFELKVADYRMELSRRVLQTDYENVESKLHRLVPVLMFEVGTVGTFGMLIPEVLVASFQLIAVIAYLFTMSWQLTTVTVILFALLALLNILSLNSFKRIEGLLSKSRFRLHFKLDRMEKGFKDLAMNREHADTFINHSIDPPSRESAQHSIKLFMSRIKIDSAVNIVTIMSFACILIFAVTSVDVSQGQLIQFLALLLFIRPAINKISSFVKQVKNVENALEQIENFDVNIRESVDRKENQIEQQKETADALISIKDLSYSYQESGFAVGPLSIDVFENEILIIKGGNGSGKSTLFRLIAGLYEPHSGTRIYKGQQVDKHNLSSYRCDFSCYFTDSPVFDDLSYLDKEKVLSRSRALIDQLEISDKTRLGESLTIEEINLSHGQQGRLNLLRLLLEDKPICFFDEWAANQDVHFKNKFYTEIIPQLKKEGKTIILISHDDKYYSIADRIITLRNGQVELTRNGQ